MDDFLQLVASRQSDRVRFLQHLLGACLNFPFKTRCRN